MHREPVDSSSNIRSAGWYGETETMEVEFASGAVYQYCPVDAEMYNSFLCSPSKGRWLDLNLKKANVPCQKVSA